MVYSDAEALAAIYKAMCCSCGTVKTFLQGVLVGATLVALTAFVTIHIYRSTDGQCPVADIHQGRVQEDKTT